MDSIHLAVAILSVISIGLYALGFLLALAIVQYLSRKKADGVALLKAVLWPLWVIMTLFDGLRELLE